LTHLQCTVGLDTDLFPRNVGGQRAIPLRALELHFDDEDELEMTIEAICHATRTTLERLALGILRPVSNEDSYDAFEGAVQSCLQQTTPAHTVTSIGSMKLLPKLRELALQRFNLEAMCAPLSSFTTTKSLLRLTLFDCDGVIKFFADLEKVGGLFQWKHFALHSSDDHSRDWDEGIIEGAGKCLQDILTSPELESLHLSWENDSWFSEYLIKTLPLISNLVSFSVCGPDYPVHHDFDDRKLYATEIHRLLFGCPTLRALAWKYPGDKLFGEKRDLQQTMCVLFMVSFTLQIPWVIAQHV
jgi:hypothetical protein